METQFKAFVDYDLRDGEWSYEEQPEWETGIPFDVHHGLILRFALPTGREYDETATLAWFREEFGAAVEALRDGGDAEFDGHNWVWRYKSAERAQEAADERWVVTEKLTSETFYLPGREVWDAADWYLGGLSYDEVADELDITAESTDDDLERAEKMARENAVDEYGTPIVLRELGGFLEQVRRVLIDDVATVKYIVERTDIGTREWWTGKDWSDVDTDAQWYDTESEADVEAARVGGSATGFEVGAD